MGRGGNCEIYFKVEEGKKKRKKCDLSANGAVRGVVWCGAVCRVMQRRRNRKTETGFCGGGNGKGSEKKGKKGK